MQAHTVVHKSTYKMLSREFMKLTEQKNTRCTKLRQQLVVCCRWLEEYIPEDFKDFHMKP